MQTFPATKGDTFYTLLPALGGQEGGLLAFLRHLFIRLPGILDEHAQQICSAGIGILLYWALLMDFTIFSMRISAFVLVCGRILVEVGLFLFLGCRQLQVQVRLDPE